MVLSLLCCLVQRSGAQELSDKQAVRLQTDSLLQQFRQSIDEGDATSALKTAEAALFAVENGYGKKSVTYGKVLYLKAQALQQLQRYPLAEACFLESLNTIYNSAGENNESFIDALLLTALFYHKYKKDYAVAEALYKRQWAIRKRNNWAGGAVTLVCLGNLYRDYINDPVKAESVMLELEKRRAEEFKKDHELYAWALVERTALYLAQADRKNLDKVLPMLNEAYAICGIKNYSNRYLNRVILQDFGSYFLLKKDYNNAIYYLKERQKSIEIEFGKTGTAYADNFAFLGDVYEAMGKMDSSIWYYQQDLQIRESVVGKQSWEYVKHLHILAAKHVNAHQADIAEKLYLEAAALLGEQHPNYIDGVHTLAMFYGEANNLQQSRHYYLILNKLIQEQLITAVNFKPEAEMHQHIESLQPGVDGLYSLLYLLQDDTLAMEAYQNALLLNNRLLENARLRENLIASQDSLTQMLFGQWKAASQKYNEQQLLAPNERDDQGVLQLAFETRQLETMLTRNIEAFQQAMQPAHWADIHKALKSDQAAIEFIRFRYYHPYATDTIRYAALLLDSHHSSPRFIALCTESELLPFFERNVHDTTFYKRMYKGVWKPNQKNLYELLFKPLEPLLRSVKTVYYAPDGLIHQLNFDAISPGNGGLLCERYDLVRLGSTRQLASGHWHDAPIDPKTALLYGGIDYGDTQTPLQSKRDLWSFDDSTTMDDFFRRPLEFTRSAPDSMRNIPIARLPGTREEVYTIAGMMDKRYIQATVFTDRDASESSLKNICTNGKASPDILHIATHGYFFPDPQKYHDAGSALLASATDPMIRSGLAFADCNYAWRTGYARDSTTNDGILTAREALLLNLKQTQLVVLSACETGLGDVVGNEGVYGLQRAFKIAGAQKLLMSLWKVDDEATGNMMVAFYQNMLEKGMSPRLALRAAQAEMRKAKPSPYYWAGFVLVE